MVAMGVIVEDRLHFFGRGVQRIGLEALGNRFGVLHGIIVGFQNGLGQRRHHALVFAHQLAGNAHHAAAEVGVFLHQVGGQFARHAGLYQAVHEGVTAADRLHFAARQSGAQQVGRVQAPFDIAHRVDAVFFQQDREEITVRTGHVGDADGLALEVFQFRHAAVHRTEQPQATAMGAGSEFHIKALLQRLEPTQCHAHARIGLAGGDGFEQHFGGVAEVDEFNLKVVLLEEPLAVGNHHRGQAHRIEVDRQLE